MRIARALPVMIFALLTLSGPAFALGLYVERLKDEGAYLCPVCHRVIVPGGVHENAESIIATEFGGALDERGVRHSSEDGEARYLDVLVYRFQERRGGNFSVERPASVGFHVHLFEQGTLSKVFVFDETQQPLSENVLRFFTFLRRGAKWLTAGELAREGVRKAVDRLAEDLGPGPKAAEQ
ncbi:MAG: hypothetical protein ABSE25_01490 [Syntrophorhabdales bacterium]